MGDVCTIAEEGSMAATTINELRDEIRDLRRTRGAHAHLPRSMREAAIRLANRHGSGAYAEMGINLQSVKRWERLYPILFLGGSHVKSAVDEESKKPRGERVGFVEIKTSPILETRPSLWPENPTSVVEVARPDGWTFRMTGELARDFVSATISKFSL